MGQSIELLFGLSYRAQAAIRWRAHILHSPGYAPVEKVIGCLRGVEHLLRRVIDLFLFEYLFGDGQGIQGGSAVVNTVGSAASTNEDVAVTISGNSVADVDDTSLTAVTVIATVAILLSF